MGSESSQPKKIAKLDKLKFEISVLKVKAHLELQRDRRQNDCTNKERALIKMISSPTRQKQDELHKASSIVSDKKFIKACDIVIRYCDILKDRSAHICDSKGDAKVVEELLPFIESIIWSAKPLNLAAIAEFQKLMTSFYGPAIYDEVQKSTKVDPELKNCFKDLMPTPTEINDYFIEFSQRHGIPLEKINECGLEVVGKDMPGPGPVGGGGGGGMINPYPQPINYAPVNFPQNTYPNYPNYQTVASNDPNTLVYIKTDPNQPQYPPNNMNYPPNNMNYPPNNINYPPNNMNYPPPNNMNYPPNNMNYPPNNMNYAPNYTNMNQPFPNNQPIPDNMNPNPNPNTNINTAKPNDDLPSLDDLDARMKRLREGL